MAEWSGFFDAHKVGDSWDRTYLADDFAKFFSPLIGNGVFAGRSNELQVFQSVPAGMSVVLSSGQSWIEGYGYINDSDLIIPIDPADGALGRIDRIVNQWSSVDRQIRTVWKKGTPAVHPVAPPLQWDADYKELNLCILDITAGLSAITQDKIKDTRSDSSVCGWVTGLIDQVDTSTLFAQWEDAYKKAIENTGEYLDTQKSAFETFLSRLPSEVIPVPSIDKVGWVPSVNPAGDGYELYNIQGEITPEKIGALPTAGGYMEGPINMNGQTLSGLNAPTEDTQAANKGYVDGKLSMELLWENASPISAFAAQTIELPGGYDYYKILYYGIGRASDGQVVDCFHGNRRNMESVSMNTKTTYYASRSVEWFGNSMVFNDAMYTPNGVTSTSEINNVVCKPLKIYGIKGVSA